VTGPEVKSNSAGGDGPPKPPLRGRRALQADQTRRDIVAAARRQFVAQGYAATTLKDIARDAGVSVQTIYDSVGGKHDLVRRLNDLIDEEADIAQITAPLAGDPGPLVVARIPARITARLIERCGDILRVVLAGSFAEPELATLLEEGQRRHRAGADAVARRLAALRALRPDVAPAAAAATIAALADFRLALILTDEFGLDPGGLEDWIAGTTSRSVLARSSTQRQEPS
jgi:AcrR family transcriptional regulator